jgi:hypothetical protein
MNGTIHILGPQRGAPNLPDIVQNQYPDAKIAVVSAGWRHEESQLRPLARDLQRPLELLPLYQWFDELGRKEPGLSKEHSFRQKKIKTYKDIYRLRLKYGMDFLTEIKKKHVQNPSAFAEDLQMAQNDIQRIDLDAIDRLQRIRSSFPNLLTPWTHPSATPFHEEIKETLAQCDVLLITGGHVAILRNRMFFFGLTELLHSFLNEGKTIIAWSAGAMTLCEQIVLYYDDPPDGEGIAEVLDTGFSLMPKTLLFPHAQQRLRIHDNGRIGDLTQRFSDFQCFTLEQNTHFVYTSEGINPICNTKRLMSDGSLKNIEVSQ